MSRERDAFSQRANEVAVDLLQAVAAEVGRRGFELLPILFHLDGSGVLLSLPQAERWIKESVDGGFPSVRFLFERATDDGVVVNLAAFEDPDSQFHP